MLNNARVHDTGRQWFALDGFTSGNACLLIQCVVSKKALNDSRIDPLISITLLTQLLLLFNPYPTAFPYGNGMVLHFYQQQESSTTKTVHKVINKGLKTYV